MTREKIKEHYADIIRAVFVAEVDVKPTLQERIKALGKFPDGDKILEVGNQYCLDVAEVILSSTSDEELKELYGED